MFTLAAQVLVLPIIIYNFQRISISSLIAKTLPHLMLLVGYGGFVVIIWLMMFKPF